MKPYARFFRQKLKLLNRENAASHQNTQELNDVEQVLKTLSVLWWNKRWEPHFQWWSKRLDRQREAPRMYDRYGRSYMPRKDGIRMFRKPWGLLVSLSILYLSALHPLSHMYSKGCWARVSSPSLSRHSGQLLHRMWRWRWRNGGLIWMSSSSFQ